MTIPVRNVWMLMFYASDLFQQIGQGGQQQESQPEDLPELTARILILAVKRRMRESLSPGFRPREASLTRVRGQIDLLTTVSARLLEKGKVHCRFEELTRDTPQNRFVRAALLRISTILKNSELRKESLGLAHKMGIAGVGAQRPDKQKLSLMHLGRNGIKDRLMFSAAQMVFDLTHPLIGSGRTWTYEPMRDEPFMRRLFEKAVAGFYKVHLVPQGWNVEPSKVVRWPVIERSHLIPQILPRMVLDVQLYHPLLKRRIVIDTKFNSLLVVNRFGREALRSGYLYQIYTYLRTQEDFFPLPLTQSLGMLLHPSIGVDFTENITLQGHSMQFATIDLGNESLSFGKRLMEILSDR